MQQVAHKQQQLANSQLARCCLMPSGVSTWACWFD
jgi:hypothetical protein